VELWAASSRGFLPAFDALLPAQRRLALATRPDAAGGNAALLRHLPGFARWLRQVRPDWIHAHYLSSHGTMAWLATSLFGAPGRLVGSAWGSDVLVTPQRSVLQRWLLERVLRACVLCTSDSAHMSQRLQQYGAGEVMTFPFGLEVLPTLPAQKDLRLFFANRGLEPIYAPQRIIRSFAALLAHWPDARLVVANDGSELGATQALARELGLQDHVRFVGRLNATTQAEHYARAGWYLSLPLSDSTSVSVLEAMAHGCIPLLSDLPANHELVRSAHNGLILAGDAPPRIDELLELQSRAAAIAEMNRSWVREQGMFAPHVSAFVERLQAVHRA
jgi:glycosyltransferase involved in cell wall biosynthesis